MNWTKQIDRCEFLLDYVRITIVSDTPRDLVKQLSAYLNFETPIPERKSERPLMVGKLALRSYFTFGRIRKAFLVYEKITGLQGINALFCIHDVPLLELVQLGLILDVVQAVTEYHFSYIEFKWDFYPKKTLPAVDLQKHIVRHLHLKSAQDAEAKGKDRRITYYINRQPCDLQAKVYIRPKKPNPDKPEFVRFELTAKTRWLEDIGLMRPSDFKELKYGKIVRQVRWLDLKLSKVRRIQLSLLTGGEWKEQIREKLEKRGLAKVIIDHRKDMVCPPGCKKRGHAVDCELNRAHKQKRSGKKLIAAIERCEFAKENEKFAKNACELSKYQKVVRSILKQGYKNWNVFPLFTPIPDKLIPSKRSKLKKRIVIKSKLKIPVLFEN